MDGCVRATQDVPSYRGMGTIPYVPPITTPTLQAPPTEEVWHVKGAMDVVLRQCVSLPDGSPLTSIDKEHYMNAAHELGMRGLRGQRSHDQTCHLSKLVVNRCSFVFC